MTAEPAPGFEEASDRGWLLARSPRTLGLAVALAYLGVFALILGGVFRLTVEGTRARAELALSELVRGIASQVDPALHEQLRESEQTRSPAYMDALEPLVRIHRAQSSIRNLYTLRLTPGGLVYVLDTVHDAELLNRSTSVTRVGESVETESIEAGMLPRVLGGEIWFDQQSYIEAGVTLHTVYAPIRADDGQIVAILGVDFEQEDFAETAWRWSLELLLGALAGLAVLSALLGAAVFLLRERLGRVLEERRLEGIRDGLTGLYNRRHFNARLARHVATAAQGDHALALLSFDVDHFKQINDAHGHPAGDEVLVRIAACLDECLRAEDIACRIGGEEFAVIMPHTRASEAAGVFRRLAGAIRRPMRLGEATRVVTVSGGIALFGAEARTPAQLLSRADRAMYDAKERGRDGCVVAGAPA